MLIYIRPFGLALSIESIARTIFSAKQPG